MKKKLKKSIKKLTNFFGYEITPIHFKPQNRLRPIGSWKITVENLLSLGLKINTIYDIGAHEGHWTQEVMEAAPNALYYLFEPNLDLKPVLEKKFLQFNTVICTDALGSQNQTSQFCITKASTGSHIINTNKMGNHSENKVVTVNTTTLDHLIENEFSPIPDLIKIDVQGVELDILSHGKNHILGKTPIIGVETSFYPATERTLHEVCSFFDSYHYQPYDISAFNRRPYDGSLYEIDLVFILKSHPLAQHIEYT